MFNSVQDSISAGTIAIGTRKEGNSKLLELNGKIELVDSHTLAQQSESPIWNTKSEMTSFVKS